MVTRQFRALAGWLIVCTLFFVPRETFAQEREVSPFGHAFKATLLDPTTYAPRPTSIGPAAATPPRRYTRHSSRRARW